MGGRKWEEVQAWPLPGHHLAVARPPYPDRLRLPFFFKSPTFFFVAHAPEPDDPTPPFPAIRVKLNPTAHPYPYVVAERGSCRRVDFMRSNID